MVGQSLELETTMKYIDGINAAGDAPKPLSAVRGAIAHPAARAPYAPPALERLGEWTALTLQQSVPIFP